MAGGRTCSTRHSAPTATRRRTKAAAPRSRLRRRDRLLGTRPRNAAREGPLTTNARRCCARAHRRVPPGSQSVWRQLAVAAEVHRMALHEAVVGLDVLHPVATADNEPSGATPASVAKTLGHSAGCPVASRPAIIEPHRQARKLAPPPPPPRKPRSKLHSSRADRRPCRRRRTRGQPQQPATPTRSR
jgi:hypothetical protein